MSQDDKPIYVAEAGAPEIKITPEMIEAGAAELRDYVLSDVGPEFRKEIAASVYEAMEATKTRHL